MIFSCVQQTPEWLQLRCGRVTASRVKDVMDFTAKGLPSAKRTGYLYEIVCERMTGLAAEHFVSPAMDWGSETEALAAESYEVHTGFEALKIGLATHPEIEMFAASPDRLVNAEWLLEIKCPMPGTHVKWIQGQVVPEDHRLQCYAEMACWGMDRVDFMSFDPRPASRYQRFIRTLERNDKIIAEIEAGVRRFLDEADEIMAELDRLCPEDGQPPAQRAASAVKEQLKKSLEIDPNDPAFIHDSDLPAWAREMKR
jgi:putative phage-type endonuclease